MKTTRTLGRHLIIKQNHVPYSTFRIICRKYARFMCIHKAIPDMFISDFHTVAELFICLYLFRSVFGIYIYKV